MLEQQLVNALSLGCIYSLFALGFTLVFGVLGIINLSHGAMFMVGAYTALMVIKQFGLPLWIAIIIAMLCSGLIGAVIDTLVLRPLRKRNAPHLIPMIATIGVAIIVNNGAQAAFGASNLSFPLGTVPEQVLDIAGLKVTVLSLIIILLSFVMMTLLLLVIRRTQFGRALRAIAESPKAAKLMGINVNLLFFVTSLVAAALGGLSGVLIGLNSNAVFPLMGQDIMLKGIAVIILGGMGDIRGAMLGGLFLGFAEVLSVAYIGSEMRDAIAFGLLFLVLLLRPQGLLGRVVQRKA
jgi:branched-chain amino acid transport system permease protein